MGIINYSASKRALTIARGHPYDFDAFTSLFTGLGEFDVCHVEQPVAQRCLDVSAAADFDAIICYDMPGVDFTAGAGIAEPVAPDETFRSNFLAMLEAGVGMVFMHHSLAAWPAWPEYADILGGRFHYRPSQFRDQQWPDSGYRHKVTHRLSSAAPHPVTDGLPPQFEMTDELYLCPILENEITPLLYSDYAFEAGNFYSSARAVAGEMETREDWDHPAGSQVVAWVKAWSNSPIVYIQGGDDAEALMNADFQQLVHNAVRWVASDEASSWAREQRRQ